jgi:hypothetical protein
MLLFVLLSHIHQPGLITILTPPYSAANSVVIYIPINIDTAVSQLVLSSTIPLTITKHTLEANWTLVFSVAGYKNVSICQFLPMAIVVVVPTKPCHSIIFPISYKHITIRKIASALTLSLPMTILTCVVIAIAKPP